MITLLLLCCLAAPAELSIDADTITLGKLIPFPEGDSRAAISLGYAPNPGLGRRIFKQDILAKLQAAGLPSGDLDLPEFIMVRRPAQGLDEERVTQAVLDAFVRQYPDANIEIVSVEIPPVQVGTGPVELSASLPTRLDLGKSIFVRLDLRGGRFSRSFFVRTNVRIETVQPVLTKDVRAQAEVSKDNVEWRPASLTGARGTVKSFEEISGMLAKRDLVAGTVLTEDVLYSPLYVQKGEAVTVKTTSGAVTISATMRAKGPGRHGDSVVLEHLTGAGTTTARVVGPRLLEVLQESK